MLESVGSLTGSPWIYAAVAVSVLLDVFLPVLPSGVLVIAAATAAAGSATGAVPHAVPDILVLTLCAATASVFGDMAAYRLAWRGGDRLDRAIARSRRLTRAQERLGEVLARGGAGAAHRRVREFLPWSVLAGVAWAGYSVALGYFGGQWLGATWLATGVSFGALFGAGAGAAYLVRRPAVRRPATGG